MKPLNGEIEISGMKNAAVAVLPAAARVVSFAPVHRRSMTVCSRLFHWQQLNFQQCSPASDFPVPEAFSRYRRGGRARLSVLKFHWIIVPLNFGDALRRFRISSSCRDRRAPSGGVHGKTISKNLYRKEYTGSIVSFERSGSSS